MWSIRSVYGFVAIVLVAWLTTSPAESAEPIIPAPSRIVLSAPSTGAVITSGTVVPPARMIDEMGGRCTPGAQPNSYAFFDVEGEIFGECQFDLGDDSFQRQYGTGWMAGNVDLETGAVTFDQGSSVTYSFLGTSNTYTLHISGTATLPGGYFPVEGIGTFEFSRTCSGETCAPGDSTYSYAGTIWFEFDLFQIGEVDLSIESMAAVQVVESADMLESHEDKVADKTTVVRVYVTADRAVGGVKVELTAKRGGVPLAAQPTLIIGSATSSIVGPDPNVEWHSFNFRLPASWTKAGALEIEAKALPPLGLVDPEPDNNGAFLTPKFLERKRITITYLPVCVVGDFSTFCPGAGIAQGPIMLNKLFPIPDTGAIYEKAALPPWVWDEPPVEASQSSRLLAALQKRYDIMTLLGLIEGPDQLAAWLPPIAGSKYAGFAHASFAGGTDRVSYSQFFPSNPTDSYRIFAHEIAHNYGGRHPATIDSCDSADPTTDWRTPGNKDTATIDAQGWDVTNDQVMPEKKKDLMSYCASPTSNLWMSEFTYDKIFYRLAPVTSFALRSAADYFVVSGSAKADGSGGTLDAGYVVTSAQPTDAAGAEATHCIRFNDSPANDWCVRLGFADPETFEPADEQSFSVVAPLPAEVTRVSLIQLAGNVELAAVEVSPAAPTLGITSPGPGDTWNHEQTVTWTLDDLDGGTLSGTLLYSADGGETWLPLAVDQLDTSFTFDTDEIRHGQVQFRVLGSDGFNTVDQLSPVVTVVGPSGDVDCSGTVDGADALGVMRLLAGLSTGKCLAAADVTCSNAVDVSDAIGIRRHIAVLPIDLPQGCPAIGVD